MINTSLVYPLADVLQMKLLATGDRIEGAMHFSLPDGYPRFLLKVVASYAQDKLVGVLCRVGGNLCMFMMYNGDMQSYYCCLIDASKLGVMPSLKNPIIPPKGDYSNVYNSLKAGILRSFTKMKDSPEWKEAKG